MQKIKTKLLVFVGGVILCVSLLVGLLIREVYREYVSLSNFRETTQVSLKAYELARKLTAERQLAYQAASFFGEGTPLEMIARYKGGVEQTHVALAELKELGDACRDHATPTFNRALDAATTSEQPLSAMRAELLNEKRLGQSKDEGNELRTRALAPCVPTISPFLPSPTSCLSLPSKPRTPNSSAVSAPRIHWRGSSAISGRSRVWSAPCSGTINSPTPPSAR